MSYSKWVFSALITWICVFVGYWIGEGVLSTGPFVWQELVGIFISLTWPLLTRGSNFKYKIFFVCASSMSFVVGDYCGRLQFRGAYNECYRAEREIRKALEAYRKEKGTYPEKIETLELAYGSFPGRRLLRGNILEYYGSQNTYKISYKDWLVTHTATESEAFTAFQ